MKCHGCQRLLEDTEPVIEVACVYVFCLRDCAVGATFTRQGVQIYDGHTDEFVIVPLASYARLPISA